MKKFYFLILFFSIFLFPLLANGALLYFSPENAEYHRGDTFISEVKLNTEGEIINSCEIKINFPAQLEIVDISRGDSVLNLWPQTAVFSDGNLSFIGGIPGGFNGEGKLISIIFHALSPGSTQVNFQGNSKVLLNDGLGTLAKLNTKSATFTILSGNAETSLNEWQEKIEKDEISPEPFEIKISQNPTIFDGKYFLVFSTIDKQTGIDHYEIMEVKNNWKIGESPYLLENQELKNKILVKAVDKAGNERLAEISPQNKKLIYIKFLIIFIAIIFFGLIYLLVKKFKFKNS